LEFFVVERAKQAPRLNLREGIDRRLPWEPASIRLCNLIVKATKLVKRSARVPLKIGPEGRSNLYVGIAAANAHRYLSGRDRH
jgi:hypothetical protein